MSLPERFPSEIPPMTRAIVAPLMKPNAVRDEEGFAALYDELGRA